MGTTWMTKYGPRRVRFEPPTFEDALFAAEGLTPDPEQQIDIVAELMQVPLDQARAEAARVQKDRARLPQTVRGRRSQAPVVVERKSPRRASRPAAR
jgi:hypothetical protein